MASSTEVKALGTRHAFNRIADTAGDMISMRRMARFVELDTARRTVTVEGGIRYGELGAALYARGWALGNLASLPHISVAGACATATHGSGDRNGCLAAAVRAIDLVTADGSLLHLSAERDGDRFRGAVVGLGALGIVARITLDILPAFTVRQDVYHNLPMAAVETGFDSLMAEAYSMSLFTNWRTPTFTQVWRKSLVPEGGAGSAPQTLFGAAAASRPSHPLAELSAENCTRQMGVPGPWHERLPHFRMEFTPSAGDELQTEYLAPRRHAWRAIRAVYGLRDDIAPLLQISEIRTVAADDLWMSPFCAEACVALHFTWLPEWTAVSKVLPRIEAALEPFEARPHWGKLFHTAPARLAALYPRLPDFRELARSVDPTGKFRNVFLNAIL